MNTNSGLPPQDSGSGEFSSGPVAGTALVSGATFARKGLLYADIEGLAIFEGDIVLGSVENVRAAADEGAGNLPQIFSIAIRGQQYRWPNATIPYDIDPAMLNQQRVTDAIAHWQANTRIRFVLRTPANTAQFPDFVHFQPAARCASSVGRQGIGQQNILLADSCATGNAIHEIGHTVGLWHEQSRADRDTFVRIVWANIDPSDQHDFAQHITDGDDIGPYDYGSIMHYPPDAFSINGQPTIIPLQALPAGVVMGQRNGLSRGDIHAVRTMYPAPITYKEIRKEIRKDPIQDTLKEAGKDPIQDTIKEAAADPGTLAEQITTPGLQPGLSEAQSASPFVMAIPSRVGGAAQALVEASAQVQELAEALVMIEQQQAELLAAYDAAIWALNALQTGQG